MTGNNYGLHKKVLVEFAHSTKLEEVIQIARDIGYIPERFYQTNYKNRDAHLRIVSPVEQESAEVCGIIEYEMQQSKYVLFIIEEKYLDIKSRFQ